MAITTTELGKVLIIFKGAWVGGGSYEKLDVVTNRDSSYICILDAPSGITLDNTTYWRPLSLGAYDYAVAAGYTGTAAQFAIDLADVSTKISTSAIANNLTTTAAGQVLDARQGKILDAALQTKVDRITGKGLSTNDYDNTEKAALANSVRKTGDETIDGVKTFLSSPILPTPTTDMQGATKKYVDDADKTNTNLYNITLAVPLTAGSYYTSTTARAAVPVGIRKRGLELLYETSAGVWYKERFIGEVANWTTPANWESVPSKSYVDAADALKANQTSLDTSIADEKAIVPSIAYYKRVIADGGIVGDKTILAKLFTDKLKSLATTQVLYMPHLGTKERTSGVNKYASKLYDAELNNLDAVQATEATQPYIGEGIAPNSLKGLKYCQGQTQTGEIAFTEKSYLATDSWTLSLMVKINKKGNGTTGIVLSLSPTIIYIYNSAIYLNSASGAVFVASYNFECGKSYYIEYQYSNGAGLIKINNIPLPTTATSSAIIFNRISNSSSIPFDGLIYYFHLQNERISEAESQQNYTLLRALFPDIEGIAIGNQFWASSNYEGTIAGDGTVIPEVQDAAAWAALTTPAWCYYNNNTANGAVYGKLYNWYAVELLSKYPPKGWRVPSKSDYDQLVSYLGGNTVAGGKMKKEGLTYWTTPNSGATNESGFSAIGSGTRRYNNGNFETLQTALYAWTSDKYGFSLVYNSAASSSSAWGGYEKWGFSLRLLRKSPVGESRRQIESGYFTTDIASAAKSIAIPFGYVVKEIRITTTTSVTSIEAKLHNTAGAAVATLITGKACNTTSTTFVVTADQPTLLQDGTVRVTAAGNNATSIGMNLTIICEKIEL